MKLAVTILVGGRWKEVGGWGLGRGRATPFSVHEIYFRIMLTIFCRALAEDMSEACFGALLAKCRYLLGCIIHNKAVDLRS